VTNSYKATSTINTDGTICSLLTVLNTVIVMCNSNT